MRLLTGNGLTPPQWIGGGAREKRIDTEVNPESCLEWFQDGTLMVMPMMNEPAYDVDVFIHHGKAKAVLARRRFNPAGIPFTGNRIVPDPTLLNYCLKIAEALELDALHDIDLLTDDNGHPCLLEVNPRPSGSVAAAHAAGYPIMAMAVAETLNIPYPIAPLMKEIDLGVVPVAIPMVTSTSIA
jgi:predicted ATP-grasp superfamily ATP-dependent carboligase